MCRWSAIAGPSWRSAWSPPAPAPPSACPSSPACSRHAIVDAIRRAPKSAWRERQPLRPRLRPLLDAGLGPLLAGIAAFEVGNVAATLLILRATELLGAGRGHDQATQLALWLYVAYNVAATVASIPAGQLGDRHGPARVLALGVGLFAVAYTALAAGAHSVMGLVPAFLAAGIAIGCVETAEHAGIATAAPTHARGSAFGVLAAIQSFGNLAASGIAGLLWTAVSPTAAFAYLAAWMLVALALLLGAQLRK